MERKNIYVEGDRATRLGAESPRFISSGESRARAETPRSIVGGELGGGRVAKSRGIMQELTSLGRNSGAH